MKRLIIDGYNLFHRLKHVHAKLRDRKGRHTGIVYGVMESFNKLCEQFNPSYVVVAFEYGQSWRYKVLSSYKSARRERQAQARHGDEEMGTDVFMEEALPLALDALRGLGVPVLGVPFLEGDDVIALLAAYSSGSSVIVSSDTDFLQLVSPTVRVYSPTKDVLYHMSKSNGWIYRGGADEPLYVHSNAALWEKAIIGDTGDSIPGVPGLGPARTHQILEELTAKHRSVFWDNSIAKILRYDIPHRELLAKHKDTLIRNEMLIRLSGSAYLRDLGRHAGYEDAKEALAKFVRIAQYDVQSAAFLAPGQERDKTPPGPYLRFFRSAEFSWAFRKQSWLDVFSRYRAMRDNFVADDSTWLEEPPKKKWKLKLPKKGK